MTGSDFTIFGGFGFIGSEIARQLAAVGASTRRIGRHDWPAEGSDLGNVIFTVGMTADFRTRLVETVELQVLRLYEALTRYRYSSFLGLSSARVYEGAASTQEDSPLTVCPTKADHTYNISKLAGESLCLAFNQPAVRIVRLSNVYGAADDSNLFMTAVLRDAIKNGSVAIGQSPESTKDYIAVEDAARLIISIAQSGKQRVYNVACGSNFSHSQIADVLEANGYTVAFKPNGPKAEFPPIDTTRVCDEFGYVPRLPASVLPGIIELIRSKRGQK